MSKPSIFSKDYVRKMKKRKRMIILITVISICVVAIIIYNTNIKKLDFTNVRASIQAWVDSGKTEEELAEENINEEVTDDTTEATEEETVEEEPKREELTVEANLAEGVKANIKYIDNNGVKEIQSVEVPEGYQYNISPIKDKVLFIDSAQNMKIVSLDGSIADITKTEYISQAGSTFPKDQILAATPTYTWHGQPKFIDDNKVIYVSELPYFGNNGAKKYVWVYDVLNNTHQTIWNFVGSDITIGDVVPEKGITIVVDGVTYYMNANGEISQ